MSTKLFVFLFLLELVCAQFVQNFDVGIPPNVQVAGDNDQCAAFCDKTYPVHTFDQAELAKSCKQGCRLFSMLQFVGDRESRNNESIVRQNCQDDCTEAYKDQNFRQACSDGCQKQAPYTSGALEISMDDSSPLFHKAMKSMMDQVSSLQNQMMDQFHSARDWFNEDFPKFAQFDHEQMHSRMQNFMDQVAKSLSTDTNNNPLFNYAGRLLGREQLTSEEPPKKMSSSESKSASAEGEHKPLRTLSDRFANGATVGNSDENNEPIIVVHMIPDKSYPEIPGKLEWAPDDDSFEHSDEDSTVLKESANEPSPPVDNYMSGDPEDDWLSCLARRARRLSMITRWMLCIALILSVSSMLWICLAIVRTAPRRRLLIPTNDPKKNYDVVYSTPSATSSDKSPMIITTKEPLGLESINEDVPPPPYESPASVHKTMQA